VWENYLKPILLLHWATVAAKLTGVSFDMKDKSTWPQVPDGKVYSMSLQNGQISNLTRLVSDNFEVQGVISLLFDPDLKLVHFGQQTHWLKLMIQPLWLLADVLQKLFSFVGLSEERFRCIIHCYLLRNMFELTGSDQAWHLVNIPHDKHGTAGKPIPSGLHFDNGQHDQFSKGIPTPPLKLGVTNRDNSLPIVGEHHVVANQMTSDGDGSGTSTDREIIAQENCSTSSPTSTSTSASTEESMDRFEVECEHRFLRMMMHQVRELRTINALDNNCLFSTLYIILSFTAHVIHWELYIVIILHFILLVSACRWLYYSIRTHQGQLAQNRAPLGFYLIRISGSLRP
jgi:hypothetical protein